MKRTCIQFLPLAATMAILIGCSPATPAQTAATQPTARPNTIIIDNFTFSPSTLTIPAGTTITWINRDDVPHTVTGATNPKTLNSPVLDTDATYAFTFKTPGTYAYYCTVHPHMTATIIVK